VGRLELPVVPGALYELYHQYLQSLPHAAQRRPEGRGGLALAGSSVNDNQSLSSFRQAHLFSVFGVRQLAAAFAPRACSARCSADL